MAMTMPRPAIPGPRPAYMDNLFRDASTHSNSPSSLPPSAHSSISSISTNASYDLRSSYYSTGRPLTPAVEEDIDDASSIRSKKTIFTPKRFNLSSILHRRTYPQSPAVPPLSRSGPQANRSRTPEPAPVSRTPSISISPTSSMTESERFLRKRPSLPRLQTSFPPPVAVSTYAKKPLPAVPGVNTPSAINAAPAVNAPPAAIINPTPPRHPVSLPPLVSSKRPSTSASVRSLSLSSRPFGSKKSVPVEAKQELSCQRCYYFTARNCNGYVMGGDSGDACEGCLQSGFFGAK